MILNNRGVSLVETLIVAAILGVNALGFMHIQKLANRTRTEDKSYQVIKNTGETIKRALSNRAICTQSLIKNASGDLKIKTGDVIPGLLNAKIDSEDYNTVIPVNSDIIPDPNELGKGVSIDENEGYKIVTLNNHDYLEVVFNIADHRAAVKKVVRRFLLNVKKDPVTGEITECLSELGLQIRSIAEASCAAQGWKFINGECDDSLAGIDPPVNTPEQDNLAPGAIYKLTYNEEVGRFELEGKNCTPGKPRFVDTNCIKGKHIGIKGVNWVNACYYASTCAEDPYAILPTTSRGWDYVVQGPTKARGGDTGTKKNCYKKRKRCEGEKEIVKEKSLEKRLEDELKDCEEGARSASLKYPAFVNAINNDGLQDIRDGLGDLIISINTCKRSCNRILTEKSYKRDEDKVIVPHKNKRITKIFKRAESIKKQVYDVDTTYSILNQAKLKKSEYEEETGNEI